MHIQRIILCLACIGVCVWPSIRLVHYGLNTFANTSTISNQPGSMVATTDSNNTVSNLAVLRVSYRQYANPIISSSTKLLLDNRMVINDFYELSMYQQPLVYPNPMQLRSTATVAYWLNMSQSIRIHIYNMFGHKIASSHLTSGMNGARMGYNKLTIGPETFGYVDLSAGIYFLAILDSMNQPIGKTKFAVVP